MQSKNKGNMILGIIIVIAAIGFFIYLSLAAKKQAPNTAGEVSDSTNVTNGQPSTATTSIEGVKITILKEGNGEVAKAGDTVAMNYTGKFLDGKAFDSNVDPKFGHVEPFIFTLGAQQVIKGWDVGVSGMRVGEKRNLVIEPAFAYGERGAGGVIPPNATLTFDVELLAIKK